MSMKLSDLREASYNPRIITQRRLDNLSKSLQTYGDLSGVVFNEATKTLISGHQRLRTLREAGIETEVVVSKKTDKFGTVKEGHIIAKTSSGEIRLPLRIVNWSDKKAEMAANIAANAHGGDFDRTKLGVLLAKLEKGKSFDIDVLGIDPLSMRSLLPTLPTVGGEGGSASGKSSNSGDDEFQEFDENSFEFEHVCPKCKFQFNVSAASKAGGEKKVNRQAESARATREAKKAKDKKAAKADKKASKQTKVDKKPTKKSKLLKKSKK